MTDNLIERDKIDALKRYINTSRRMVITCHISPDGDAMGSSLALCRILRNAGIEVKVITPDTPPKYLMFLPGAEHIVVYSRFENFANKLLAETDLIFCLDYNDPKRVDLVSPGLLASPAPKVMIDHHLYPDTFPDLVISHPEVSSTSALIYKVISAVGMQRFIDFEAATAIYTGMMTDTGNFSYNSNDPSLYRIIARLLEKGIDKDWIYKKVYFNNSINRLRLNGYAMSQKLEHFAEHKAALITLTRKELNEYHYQKGDTEDLVNRPLTCPDIVYSIFLREETDYIKVSTRSKGSFPVNKMCSEYFNGGGHLNAAGGEFYGTLDEAVARLHEAMPEFDRYLPE
ncbi:MAG: bifunctional oligoribonuclease/PAP phosphatase NrnA [Muribaculaceae bacterium]|nr:bifunctional oligoribonuclease/PAP phosphatase NrnA [Muribaculaceae bacterium]